MFAAAAVVARPHPFGTVRRPAMANPFVHIELNTTDLPKARAFYSQLFDWKLEDMSMDDGTYTLINVGEGTGGGMMTTPPGGPVAWLPYVLVNNVAAATK